MPDRDPVAAKIDALLADLDASWSRDAFGIWRPRVDEPERIIRVAGRRWRVTRDGSSEELPTIPGRPVAAIYLTLLEHEGTQGSVQVYRVKSRRRLPRRGRARHHRTAPRTFVTKNADPDKLLTVRQVADALGVHPDTVRKWLDAGAISATRVGPPGTSRRRVRVRAAELRRLTD